MSSAARIRRPTGILRASGSALLALAALLAAVPEPAIAGEYSVSPLRIDLDRDGRSGVVTLANSGASPIDFQVSVLEWTQDAGGQDRYTPTGDVVFFPRILTIGPGESRVVRVGIQSLPASVERPDTSTREKTPSRSRFCCVLIRRAIENGAPSRYANSLWRTERRVSRTPRRIVFPKTACSPSRTS